MVASGWYSTSSQLVNLPRLIAAAFGVLGVSSTTLSSAARSVATRPAEVLAPGDDDDHRSAACGMLWSQ